MEYQLDAETAMRDVLTNGFHIARGLIDRESINQYIMHRNSSVNSWRNSPDVAQLSGWEFPTDIHRRDRGLWDFIMQERLQNIVSRLLSSRGTDGLLQSARVVPHVSLVYWFANGQGWHFDEVSESMFGINAPPFQLRQNGAWIALDYIDEDSGPFGFIPNSHLYDYRADIEFHLFRERYEGGELGAIDIDFDSDGNPIFSNINQPTYESDKFKKLFGEMFDKFITSMIERGVMTPSKFIASPGDVLFWDGRLIHCAHKTKPGNVRKMVIAHYHLSDNPAHFPIWNQ